MDGSRDEDATADVEYRGLLARSWDVLRGDTSDWADRPFYLEAIARFGEPALDVGCGTGRLLLEYLGQGIDIDGVDVSDDMLELCRAKANDLGLEPRLYRQGMEWLDLPRRYRSIIVPSSSFQLLLDPAAAREAMRRFLIHLKSGGALVMPFIVFGAADEAGVEFVREKVGPDGSLIRKHASYRYDPATQLESTEELFERLVDGEVVESQRSIRSPATRGYTPEQATELFEWAGFQIDRLVADFTDRPYEPGDEIFTIIGRRASD